MADFVSTATVDQFNSDITQSAQQKESRLRSCVRTETGTGDSWAFDLLVETAMEPRMGTHIPTNWGDPDGVRRWVTPAPFDKAFMVDKPSKLRLLGDPTNEYTVALARAAGRAIDAVIIEAFNAAAKSGRSGSGTTAYDTGMDVAAGGVGFTFDKSLEALENLNAQEEDDNDRYIAITARQLRDILNLPEFTSADYATVKALQSGSLDSFLGFNWKRLEGLEAVSTTRYCPYWQKTAMILGMAQEGQSTVDRLPEHRNSIGVQYQIDMGAVRMRESGVGQILCVE